MAQIKVSELTALTNTDGAEEVLINDGGTSKKVTIANLLHDNSLDSKHYIDGSIDTAHIADNAITSAKLGVDVIVAEDIAANAITVSEISNSAVTYAKIQNVSATNRILGRDSASAGVVEEITPANLLTMLGVEAGATADQTAAQIKTALENGIDSVHYVDGSIDTAHIGDDQVTADKLANSINTAIAANTAKTGITSGQASAITANTAKTGITSGQTSAITANTAKVTNATHSGEVTGATALTIADNIVDEANLKVGNDPTNGLYLQAQSGQSGGLTWAAVDALPTQTSNSGKFLTTNGSAASWAVLDTDANTTTKGLYEMANVISANYVIANNNNAMSAGPITINSNISVTVPSGSTWVIA